MNDNELKNIANYLADAFLTAEDEFVDKFSRITNKIKTVREGYVIGKLCDVYREAKAGNIDMSAAKELQRQVFLEGAAL